MTSELHIALLARADYLRCVTVVGDDTDLIVLLLHKTKETELNTAQLFFRTKECTGTHSPFLLGVWKQHDFQDIYKGQQSSSESLELAKTTGCQLLFLRTVMCLVVVCKIPLLARRSRPKCSR